MQRRSMFHLLALLMAVLTFSMPFAQHTLVQAAQTQPSAQHTQGASCLMPGISIAPTSDFPQVLYAQQLLGKSPEYVADYAQTAQTAKKKGSTQTGVQGCVVAGVIIIVVGGGCCVLYGLYDVLNTF